MSFAEDRSCGCGPLPHPPLPDIPAGLPTLPGRQLSGFPEYRAAMLSAIAAHPEFADWRARSEGDLGVMLLEAWSVVLDTTGFYDARVSERSYLSTAPDAATARNLTALIGHQPRPAMAAKVRLAVDVEGADPLTLKAGTGFRSGAFDDEAPQVFELVTDHVAWPQRNRLALAPYREPDFDGTLRFLSRQAPSAGALLVLWTDSKAAALRVASVEADPAPDGITYQKIVPETESTPGLDGLKDTRRDDINVAILRIAAPQFRAIEAESTGEPTFAVAAYYVNKSDIVLDSLYPQVRDGQRAVIEVGTTLHPVEVTGTSRVFRTVDSSTDPATRQAVTRVTFTPGLDWASSDDVTLHLNPFNIARPSRIAQLRIGQPEIDKSGDLVAPVDLADAPGGGAVIARGAATQGVELAGTVVDEGDGQAHFAPSAGAPSFDPLQVPVHLHGNVVEAVRGETVGDEELGSGDASRPRQRFKLKKSPLAWVEDASLPAGRRPELIVRVNAIEWTRVDTFYDRTAEEQIYVVTLDEAGDSWVEFGDGLRGARLPSGVGNVRATYRHGAGAAKPPPGSIAQIARPVKGLLGVIGPLPATGGSDAETPADLRENAPASALTLGRAVSLQDFEAMARDYDGVVNAASAWAWDTRRQRASVRLWIIADSGDPSAGLADYLSQRAAPDLTIAAELATAADFDTLAITLAFADGHDPDIVRDAVKTALHDPETGLLAPRNQIIGAALFRSALTHRIHAVPGVASIRSILLDGSPMDRGVAPGQGKWFDLHSGTTVT